MLATLRLVTRMLVEGPDASSSIPNIGAEFLCFTSKSVEVWPNLLLIFETGRFLLPQAKIAGPSSLGLRVD